jgi:shikimate dehydrogenase
VIGRPIEHSLSPVIHNAAFAALGLAWTYEAFDVGEDEVSAFVARAVAEDFGGLNVTMPDKAAAAAAVDRLTADAAALGAVNTVVFDGGETVGDNTDGPGFVDALAAEVPSFDLDGARCAIVGAGGAARAIVLALARSGVADVVVVNRTPAKAATAVALAPDVTRIGTAADIGDASLVVNATPVGMGAAGSGTEGAEALPFDPALLGPGQVVCDLIYWPAETALMRAAVSAGARAVNGLGMLVHQAARSFTLWTRQPAPVGVMTDAVRRELARRG